MRLTGLNQMNEILGIYKAIFADPVLASIVLAAWLSSPLLIAIGRHRIGGNA